MPNLDDLLFGGYSEVGISNPAIKNFFKTMLWESLKKNNKKINTQEAIFIRVQIRDFNDDLSDPNKSKEEYQEIIKNFILPFVGTKATETLLTNFTENVCVELKRFAVLTQIKNHRLRSLFLNITAKTNYELPQIGQVSQVKFVPTLEEVYRLNHLVSELKFSDSIANITTAIQQAFGKDIQFIINNDTSSDDSKIITMPLNLELLLAINNNYTNKPYRSETVITEASVIYSILHLNQINNQMLKLALQEHVAANPLFAIGMEPTAINRLAEQLLLVPYNTNVKKYTQLVDATLQRALDGMFAQDKFQGQGIPSVFFSENGPASIFSYELHRLAPLNLISEPILKNILCAYLAGKPQLKVTLDEIVKFNNNLSRSYLKGENFLIRQQLKEIIQTVFPGFTDIDSESIISDEDLQAIHQDHQRVKVLYTIPNDFLKTQLLFFASSHEGKNFTPTNVEVNALMALIGSKITDQNNRFPVLLSKIISNHLSYNDFEKIVKLVWPEINFQYSGILSAEYYSKSIQIQALYAVARPEIRTVLFHYASLPEGNKFYSFNQVENLNSSITKHAVLDLKKAEDFIALLNQSEIMSSKNIKQALLEELAVPVMIEANRLRPLYGIYFAPLRNLLIEYALVDTEFNCTELQVLKLNNIVLTDTFFKDFEKHYLYMINSFEQILAHQNSLPNKNEQSYEQLKSSYAYDLIVKCFAVSVQEIWDDNVAANFVKASKLLKDVNLKKPDFFEFSVTKFSKNLVATQWFNEYITGTTHLQNWFYNRFSLRDVCIDNLMQHLHDKDNFEKYIGFELNKKSFSNLNLYRYVFQKNLFGAKHNLVISDGNNENCISKSALRDFFGLVFYTKHQHYLLEFKQPLVKQILINFWSTNVHDTYSDNELAYYLEPILVMGNPDAIAEHLSKVFIGNPKDYQEFKQALLHDMVEGGGGLNTHKGVLRLKGQIRLYQLKALGLKQYANSILNSSVKLQLQINVGAHQTDNQENLLEELGEMIQTLWIDFLIKIFSNLDYLIIKDDADLINKIQYEREHFTRRVKPLIKIEYTKLSLALFAFAFSSTAVGNQIVFTDEDVTRLNDLVNAHTLLDLDSAEKLDELIHKAWPATARFKLFCNDGVIADYAESVLAEARQLRNLAYIQIPGVREYLTKIAINLPDFKDWSLVKINKLNELLLEQLDLSLIKYQLPIIVDNIWPELKINRFTSSNKDFNYSFELAVNSCQSLIPGIRIFNDLLASLDSLRELFLSHVIERDAAIVLLAKIGVQGLKESTEFVKNFWLKINEIINGEQIEEEKEQLVSIFEFLWQQLGINQHMFIQALNNDNTEKFFNEFKITARYWGLVFYLKDKLMDFPFLYQPKVISSLIQYEQQNGLFDPDSVINALRQKIHTDMNVISTSDLLVELFAPGSKAFENLLFTSKANGGVGLNAIENLKVLLGQLRLSEFKVRSFARWLNNLAEVCRFEALQTLGAFSEAQWQNWQTAVISKLAAANTKNNIDILRIISLDENLRLLIKTAIVNKNLILNVNVLKKLHVFKEEELGIAHPFSMHPLDAELIKQIVEEAKNVNTMLSLRSSIRSFSSPLFNNNYSGQSQVKSETPESIESVQTADALEEFSAIYSVNEGEENDENNTNIIPSSAAERSPPPSP